MFLRFSCWSFLEFTVCLRSASIDVLWTLDSTRRLPSLIWSDWYTTICPPLKCLYETRFVSCFCVLGYFFRGGGFSIRQSIYTQQGNMLVDRFTGGYLVRFIHFNTLIAQQWWRFFFNQRIASYRGVFFSSVSVTWWVWRGKFQSNSGSIQQSEISCVNVLILHVLIITLQFYFLHVEFSGCRHVGRFPEAEI